MCPGTALGFLAALSAGLAGSGLAGSGLAVWGQTIFDDPYEEAIRN